MAMARPGRALHVASILGQASTMGFGQQRQGQQGQDNQQSRCGHGAVSIVSAGN